MKLVKFFLVLASINVSFIYAENSLSISKPDIEDTQIQISMLINRQASLRVKIFELEALKNNTQNPFLLKQTISDLKPLHKEIEVIEKIQKLVSQQYE
jgi:hypothetical protein